MALYTNKIKKMLEEHEMITPVVDSLLAEMVRIEKIRDALFKQMKDGNNFKVCEEYTNKAGATNTVINPAIKEYKAYCQQFNNLIKTLDALTGNPREEGRSPEPDPFEKIRDRKKPESNGT